MYFSELGFLLVRQTNNRYKDMQRYPSISQS